MRGSPGERHVWIGTKRPLEVDLLWITRKIPGRGNPLGCNAIARPVNQRSKDVVTRVGYRGLRRAAECRVEGVGPGPSSTMPQSGHHEQPGRLLELRHASHFTRLTFIELHRLTRSDQGVRQA